MAGEYRLLAKLGEGGCGAVYAAEHPVLKRRAAVKVLHRAPAAGSSGLGRFIAEARAVHQVRSRHIVDVFSFGELDDGRPFYVMDLLEGEPLDRYLARLGRLSVAATLQILRPLAGALDLAHAAGIVHRDVKPQNVFLALEGDGEILPKLLDFGVAKLTHDVGALTVSGAVVGTPLYMSPEQARGEQVDARSDVYALGVLAHELLTGSLPIRADNTIGLALALLTQAPTRPSALCPELPAQIDAPILRMLAKSPDERPASAGEAIALLARAAQSAGVALAANANALPALAPRGAHARVLAPTVTASGIVAVSRARERKAPGQAPHPTGRTSALPARGIVSACAGAALVALVALASHLLGARSSAPAAVSAANAARVPSAAAVSAAAAMPEDSMRAPVFAPPELEGASSAAISGGDASAQASASPGRAPAESPLPSARANAEPAAAPRAPPRRARLRARERIPSDLESPF